MRDVQGRGGSHDRRHLHSPSHMHLLQELRTGVLPMNACDWVFIAFAIGGYLLTLGVRAWRESRRRRAAIRGRWSNP
jgi:hypothetical protein